MARENWLAVGESRIGAMIDGLPETPEVAVMLRRTGEALELTIPFMAGLDDPYRYWFSSGVAYGDDPDRTKRRYEPPRSISFFGRDGPVAFINSRERGATLPWGSGGEGWLVADYVVFGARNASWYEEINGLRSDIEGLGTFVGLRALNPVTHLSEDGRLRGVDLKLEALDDVPVARRLNTRFQANWGYGPGRAPDQTVIDERMQVATEVRSARSWTQHLDMHLAIRDLLRVAAWRDLDFTRHEALSKRDPVRTMDGMAHGDQWHRVLTRRTGLNEQPQRSLDPSDFLYRWQDIGQQGIGRWLRLKSSLSRGMDPLVSILDLRGATIEAAFAQVGIGFESLGYELLLADGMSRSKAGQRSFEARAETIVGPVTDALPFPVPDFLTRLRLNYRALKHADNQAPDAQDMYLTHLQAIQGFRAWVGVQLGVPREALKRALASDRVTQTILQISARG